MKLQQDSLAAILRALDRQIGLADGAPIGLVVCGGSALAALGLVMRTTRDVDVLASARIAPDGVKIERLTRFPDWLQSAAARVSRDFGLAPDWLNLGPAPQLTLGLPDGLAERLEEKEYGRFLSVYYISRYDQIHFKLYAAVDRDDYHTQDLFRLNPTEAEIRSAVSRVLTRDVSFVFRATLKDFLNKHGYGRIAETL